jgi:hypothetical protein
LIKLIYFMRLKLIPPAINLKQARVGASQFRVKFLGSRTLPSDDFAP